MAPRPAVDSAHCLQKYDFLLLITLDYGQVKTKNENILGFFSQKCDVIFYVQVQKAFLEIVD